MQMDINELMRYLPHRYPFLLVDRITHAEPGKYIEGYKNVTANEPFFTGHFPTRPIMPGVLMIEGMAQIAGILIYLTNQEIPGPEPKFVLAGVDDARFKRMVIPGDRIVYKATILKERKNIWKFTCTTTVDDQIACKATIINAELTDDK
jgi:3-hydroxyacyl-[acyl-carrier-protein] dehydratase